MGLAVSTGKDNDELIDNLVGHDSVKSEQVEKIMRLVDRGFFMPVSAARENAYKDSAWKAEEGGPGFLHISAPCIYASVLENLDLQEGLSFLNIGSGTGYLNTMVGFFLGEFGINHGIELYDNVVQFANERIAEFLTSKETSAFDWCIPEYFVGNAFQIEAPVKYDRIYCGALVPDSHRAYFCSFLKQDGVLIMPYGHALQKITRKSDQIFNTRDLSAVTFSHLIPVNPNSSLTNRPVKLPHMQACTLQSICRSRIRKFVRNHLISSSHEVKMRVICNSKKRHDENENEEEASGEREADNEPPQMERPERPPRIRMFPRLINHPVLLFEEREERVPPEDEVGREGEEQEPANPRRVIQMRHLFTMLARDRIQRHHAARAQQAAQEPAPMRVEVEREPESESDSEEENELPHRHAMMGGQAAQLYTGPDDKTFGFQFIPERDVDDEEGTMRIQHLLEDVEEIENRVNDEFANENNEETDYRPESESGGEREDDGDEVVEETSYDTSNTAESHHHDQETDENDVFDIANENVEEENGEDEAKGSECAHMKSGEECEPPSEDSNESFATAQQNQEDELPMMDDIDEAAKDAENGSTSVTKSETKTINSAKRPRTFTANSFDSAPQASKIKRNFVSNKIDHHEGDAKPNSSHMNHHMDEDHAYDKRSSSTSSSSTSTNNTSSSSGNTSSGKSSSGIEEKKENPEEISSEQQIEQLNNFRTEFHNCIDTFPLTVQMRNFLKYQVD